jgi:hypothetical protein
MMMGKVKQLLLECATQRDEIAVVCLHELKIVAARRSWAGSNTEE